MQFEKDSSAFSDPAFKTQIIHAVTQLSQGILLTIYCRTQSMVSLLCSTSLSQRSCGRIYHLLIFVTLLYLILITSGSTEGL